MILRKTSLEQLSVAEFRDEQTKPKVYEDGHKKVLGVWFDLALTLKYRKIQSYFSTSKIS